MNRYPPYLRDGERRERRGDRGERRGGRRRNNNK